MRTTVELYEFVRALPPTDRPLAVYLRALYRLIEPHRAQDGLSLDALAELLRAALTSEPAQAPAEPPRNEFEALLWRQIGELETTTDIVGAERDGRWFNAYVNGYLERAADGMSDEIDAFLGWDDLRFFLLDGQYRE